MGRSSTEAFPRIRIGRVPHTREPGTARSRSAIDAGGFRNLDEGQRVDFEITQGNKGPQATDVRVI